MNWLALSPAEIAVVWAALAAAGAVALPASPAPAAPESFHAAFLGQRAADFAAAPPEASRALGVPGADSFFVAARSGAGESAMGPRVRGPQRCDRARRLDLVAGASRGRTGLDRPGTRGSAARAGFAPRRRPRAAASRGGGCAADSAVHHGPCGAAPRHSGRATFERRRRSSARPGNGPRGAGRVRDAAFWFTSAPASSMRSKRAASTNFARKWNPPTTAAAQPQFLVRLVGDWASVQNRGITRLSLRRDAAQPDRWHLLTQLKNYSNEKADVVLKFSVNGQPLGQRKVSLAPEALANAEDEFTWDQGGLLQAEISPSDALQADDRAIVNLPTFRTVRVAVFAEQRFSVRRGLAQRAFEQSLCAGADSASGTRRRHFPGRRDLSGSESAVAAGLQFHLVSQRPAGCRFPPAARYGMELAASGDALGPHARHQRAQSRHAQSPARRYRSGLHRGRSAGAVDFGARTKWAQNSDHRLRSSRFQFSAGVGVSRC